jgi:Ca2+/Na+ antiporter
MSVLIKTKEDKSNRLFLKFFSMLFATVWVLGLLRMIVEGELELFAWAGCIPIILSLVIFALLGD